MAEKSQNADSGKEIKEKKKRQHNNRKVFRLCRQTLKIACHYINITKSHFAENDTAACTPCLGPHRQLILTAILLNFSQTYLKILYIQKIEK